MFSPLAQGTSNSVLTQAMRELRLLLLRSCQCTLPYDFTEPAGYFTCTPFASDYIILRARVSTTFQSSIDLASLMANLTSYITGNDRDAMITINGGGYKVSPGPCGLTVSHFNSPHCFNDTFDSEVAPTQPVIITSTLPQDDTTATPITDNATPITDNTQPVVIQDNTAVIAIVGVMCGATMVLVFSGCILILLLFLRMKKM